MANSATFVARAEAAEIGGRRTFGGDIQQVELRRCCKRSIVSARLLSAEVSVAARIPTALAARNWSCIKAISGEMTMQVPSSSKADSW
jgi:hypothetical protein